LLQPVVELASSTTFLHSQHYRPFARLICTLSPNFFIWRNNPQVRQGLLIHEVSISHTTHHSR
jgi:hypothetical protein